MQMTVNGNYINYFIISEKGHTDAFHNDQFMLANLYIRENRVYIIHDTDKQQDSAKCT